MKTVQAAQRPAWWLLRFIILVMVGLLWLVEFVAVTLTARIGLQLGIVISGLWLMWYWLRRNWAAMAPLEHRAPRETGLAEGRIRC